MCYLGSVLRLKAKLITSVVISFYHTFCFSLDFTVHVTRHLESLLSDVTLFTNIPARIVRNIRYDVWKGNAKCLFVYSSPLFTNGFRARLRERSTIEFSRYAVTRNVYELPLAGMHLHARHGACSDIPDNDERDANDRCILVKACSLSRNVYSGLNRIQSFAVVERRGRCLGSPNNRKRVG